MKIYVAGPYCPKDCAPHEVIRKAQENVNKAIDAGIRLMDEGHIVFIPHLSHFIHIRMGSDWGQPFWYQFDLEWLRCCDAILMLPNWETSHGCTLELQEAKKLGLMVFHSIEDVGESKK